MDIIKACKDPKLFGLVLDDLMTWSRWLVFAKTVFGLPLTEKERQIAIHHTGRNDFGGRGFREIACICGRRSGKSFFCAILLAFLASFYDVKRYLSRGERGVILCIATDKWQAGIIFRYLTGFFEEIPLLASMVVEAKAEEIVLKNHISIMIRTCSYRAIRGYSLAGVVCEELAFWKVDGINPDKSVVDALRPGMLTIPTAKLFLISTAYAKSGLLYETYRDFYGRPDPDVLVWRGTSLEMNPTLSERTIQRELERDQSVALAEYFSEFRQDLEGFLAVDSIQRCVVPGRTVLEPQAGLRYAAFVDPSGGRNDAFAMCIGHRQGDKIVVDRLERTTPPFEPRGVVRRYAGILKRYDVHRVSGDRYSGEWVVGAFRESGIMYEAAHKSKSELYLVLEPVIVSGEVELLDHKVAVSELRQLERRVGSGRDTVDHPFRGADDVANCIAGCVDLLKGQPAGLRNIVWVDSPFRPAQNYNLLGGTRSDIAERFRDALAEAARGRLR